MSGLAGRFVLVIGGTSGIGLATAQRAATLGARVIVAGRRPERVSGALDTLPNTARGMTVDIRDPEAVAQLFDDIPELDHLVFTAGEPLILAPMTEVTLESARQQFELRYFAALLTAQHATHRLSPRGSITFSSGTVSQRPTPHTVVPASYTAAIEGLTRALAVELAPLRVNAVSAGLVHTPMWNEMPDADRTALFSTAASAALTGRIASPPMSQPHTPT